MTSALEKGDRVEIRGLCSFYVKGYEEYTGRNPKTGETIIISISKFDHIANGVEKNLFFERIGKRQKCLWTGTMPNADFFQTKGPQVNYYTFLFKIIRFNGYTDIFVAIIGPLHLWVEHIRMGIKRKIGIAVQKSFEPTAVVIMPVA